MGTEDQNQGQNTPNDEEMDNLENQGDGSGSGDEEEFDRERAMSTIRHLRKYEKEAKSLRQKLRKLEQGGSGSGKPETEETAARLSEVERNAAVLEEKVAQAEVKADFVEKALKAGVVDLKLAYLAAQADDLLGDYDEGHIGPHNFTALKKNYPHLFRAGSGLGSGDGAAGTRRPGKGDASSEMNNWIRRSSGRN